MILERVGNRAIIHRDLSFLSRRDIYTMHSWIGAFTQFILFTEFYLAQPLPSHPVHVSHCSFPKVSSVKSG